MGAAAAVSADDDDVDDDGGDDASIPSTDGRTDGVVAMTISVEGFPSDPEQ